MFSFGHISVPPVTKISANWQHFRFTDQPYTMILTVNIFLWNCAMCTQIFKRVYEYGIMYSLGTRARTIVTCICLYMSIYVVCPVDDTLCLNWLLWRYRCMGVSVSHWCRPEVPDAKSHTQQFVCSVYRSDNWYTWWFCYRFTARWFWASIP